MLNRIKGRWGTSRDIFLKLRLYVHIRYQMKGLDELSWKMSKNFFFDVRRPCWGLKWPLKCIKTAFTARQNSSPIFKIHVYMLYQNDHNNISPAKTERIFYILPLVIFYAPRFLAVSIFHVIWYWEVPFDPQTIEKVKKKLSVLAGEILLWSFWYIIRLCIFKIGEEFLRELR